MKWAKGQIKKVAERAKGTLEKLRQSPGK